MKQLENQMRMHIVGYYSEKNVLKKRRKREKEIQMND